MTKLPKNLNRWIQNKLNTYDEKPREGIPKGQSYGIPKKKYHAALLHLALRNTLNLKDIAREAEVSYSVLLNWRMEDKFTELIKKATEEYSQTVVDFIYGDDVIPNLENYEQFADKELSSYSLSLFEEIVKGMVEALEKPEGSVRSVVPQRYRDRKIRMKFILFLYAFSGTALEGDSTDKSQLDKFHKQLGNALLFQLKHLREDFELAGSKREQHEVFDLLFSLAEQGLKTIVNLKRENIELQRFSGSAGES